MAQYLTARKVEDIPETASVSDYDELPEDTQKAVRGLAEGDIVSGHSRAEFDGDIVRFTDYYRIRVAGARASD